MSFFQGTDLFVINRGGVNYKTTYDDLVTGTGINGTDEIMVQRGDTMYSIQYQELGQAVKPIQQNDYFLVQRGDEMYAAEATGALSTVPNLSISCDGNVADDGNYLIINYFNARGYNDQPAQIRNAYTRQVFYIAGTGTAIVPKSFVTDGGGLTVRLYGQFDSYNFSGSKGLKSANISSYNAADYSLLLPNPSENYGSQMFEFCTALSSVDNRLPVKSMYKFLKGCTSFNSSSVPLMDVTGVKNFSSCFEGCQFFTQANIKNWDMTSADSIDAMFKGCVSFNGDLSTWRPQLANVRFMQGIFEGATIYNHPMDTWDTSNVVGLNGFDRMFLNATNFSQDLSGWCVSQISYTPYQFSTGSALTQAQLPVWGSCP